MKKIFWLMIFILLLLGGYTYWQDEYAQTPATQEVKIELPMAQEEIDTPVTARIDIYTKLVDKNKHQFDIYVDDEAKPRTETTWMPKNDLQGYVIQKNGKEMVITLKMLNDAEITVDFRGPDVRDDNGKRYERWVNYTVAQINGEDIISSGIYVWHNKPFKYTLNAKAGETYKLRFEWTKADIAKTNN